MNSSNSEEVDGNSPSAEGYDRAIALLHACATTDGFVATPTERDNYRRIWARDGTIMALASLLSGDSELMHAARNTFTTLARFQGPHGEIPSNVDTVFGRVSYGGTTGRVDADLWFIIGCGEYWYASDDESFLEQLLPVLEKVRFLLGAWEFNNRGLLYVPLTGDWADEYLHNGYVLYDQLLYLQALRTLAHIHAEVHGSSDHVLHEKIAHLRHLIRANYWFDGDGIPDDAYHEVLYRKGLDAATHCAGQHWMASFSPTGYSYRFDTLANVLSSLFDVADDEQRDRVDRFIEQDIKQDDLPLLPAFHPVIEALDQDWEDLQMMFSYTFKNKPYEFHNGGLWPMVSGFYVADLARRHKTQAAKVCLDAIHRANAMPMSDEHMNDEPWGFPEFIHGRDHTPGGVRHQGWSAAGAVIGHHALEGQPVFKIDDRDGLTAQPGN